MQVALDAAKSGGASYADVRVSARRQQNVATRDRIVTGIGSPVRQWWRASTLMIGSNAHEMKSANCISATGRRPISEAPVQAPTMAVSASGASSTRHGPNSAWKPWVTLNAPP